MDVAGASAEAFRDHVYWVAEFSEFDDCGFFAWKRIEPVNVFWVWMAPRVLFTCPTSDITSGAVMDNFDVSPGAPHSFTVPSFK